MLGNSQSDLKSVNFGKIPAPLFWPIFNFRIYRFSAKTKIRKLELCRNFKILDAPVIYIIRKFRGNPRLRFLANFPIFAVYRLPVKLKPETQIMANFEKNHTSPSIFTIRKFRRKSLRYLDNSKFSW